MRKLTIILILSVCFLTGYALADPNRPIYHFTPSAGWINDPTGLVEKDGVYHLFYQYYNGGYSLSDGQFKDPTVWGPMHWGHATSRNLMQWKQQPVALSPDKRIGDTAVEGMIFSGSAVFDRDNTSGFGTKQNPPMVAMYTLADTFGADSGQRQAIAYSLDSGLSWKKYSGNPVLPKIGKETFRDPQVFWYGATSNWAMVISCGDRLCFYNSPDLKQWTQVSEFGKEESGAGIPWECPDLFPLVVKRNGKTETKWILVVSVQHGAPSGSFGTRYFIGDFDGKTFKNSAPVSDAKWLDYGSDFYAARTWISFNEDLNRRVLVAWMANWTYAKTLPASTYRGSMTVPRELSLQFDESEYYLAQQPVKYVSKGLSAKKINIRIDDNQPSRSVSTGTVGEIDIDFKISSRGNKFSVNFFKTDDQKVAVVYDPVKSEISVDRRSYPGYRFQSDKAPQRATVKPKNGHLIVRAYLDHNSLELFINDGAVTFTNLVYPNNQSSQKMEASASRTTPSVLPAKTSSTASP